jgi:heat shock protein HtpX
MSFMKRILVFMLINLLVMTTITLVMSVFNVQPYLTRAGLDYGQLAIYCLIWGFTGSLISLALSRTIAKWTMGVKIIDPSLRNSGGPEAWLLERVYYYSNRAGLTTMPEVGVYNSPELNAFATGPSRNRSLVGVSSGLLNRMDKDQIEGVLAHEVAHIANGDMVTMTLVQGVMNAFVMFIARIIAFAISQNVKEESRPMVRTLTTLVLEIFLSVLAMFVVAYVSRLREYRADKGGADLAGREKMIRALEGLQKNYSMNLPGDGNEALATLKISGKSSSFLALMSTHPSLENRIQALKMRQ